MNNNDKAAKFKWGILTMMLMPYFVLSQVSPIDRGGAIFFTIALITFIGLLAFIIKNRDAILASIIGTFLILLFLAILSAIPILGWIADVAIIIFSFASALNSIKALAPIAIKAVFMWAVFSALLIPGWHDTIYSSIGYSAFCLLVTTNLSRKVNPYGEFLILISSIPLLIIVIASLGKFFRTTQFNTSVRVDQAVRGYTTKAGVSVDGYLRSVSKDVVATQTAINPNAVIGSSAGASAVKTENT